MLIRPFTPEAVQMILQLALRLRELHALGYVHRDLKPGNVMWLPRENRWTLIDFGCVARTGENARLVFSLKYAAPEIIAAYRSGAQTIIAQVWCCCVHSMITVV
jgi:eukaryotic-like serine/threonine-protein kinase